MKSIIDLARLGSNDGAIATTLKDMAKQLDEDQPFAIPDKETSFIYRPGGPIAWKVVKGLRKKGLIKMDEWAENRGDYTLTFESEKLNKWIKENFASEKVYDFPEDVHWDEKNLVLKFADREMIQFDKSSEYVAVLRFYMANHNVFIPHKRIKEVDNRFTTKKIVDTIGTLRKIKSLKESKRVLFKSISKGAYKVIISEFEIDST